MHIQVSFTLLVENMLLKEFQILTGAIIAERLSKKWHKPYSLIPNWIKVRLTRSVMELAFQAFTQLNFHFIILFCNMYTCIDNYTLLYFSLNLVILFRRFILDDNAYYQRLSVQSIVSLCFYYLS